MPELCYFDHPLRSKRGLDWLGCRGRTLLSKSDVEKLIPKYIERKRQDKQKRKAHIEERRELTEEKRQRSLEAAIRATNDGSTKQNVMRKEYHLMRTHMTKYIKEEAPKLKSNYYMTSSHSTGFCCECSTCSKLDNIKRQEVIEGIKQQIENNLIWLEMYTIDVIPLPEKEEEEVKPKKVEWCGRCRSQHEIPQCEFIALPISEGGHIPDMMYE